MGRIPDSPHEGGDGKATGAGASVRTNGEAARENSGSTGVSRGVVGGSSLLTERGWYLPEAQLQPSLSGVLKTDNCRRGCPLPDPPRRAGRGSLDAPLPGPTGQGGESRTAFTAALTPLTPTLSPERGEGDCQEH